MKIVIDKAIPFIQNRFPAEVDVVYVPGSEITSDIVKDADALIVRTRTRCDANLLKGSKVKLVATATIGTDHIDVPWCESHGIIVRSAPGCNAPGVAQYVLSSILKLGFDPKKDVLGIIGYGNVGNKVAEWSGEIGVKTLITDSPREASGKRDIVYKSMEEVLRNSDVVTLHVPLTKDGGYPTYKMIGKNEISLMKPGAILINSSRGGVVDENDLKEMLGKGKIRAVVDVWEKEPEIDSKLVEMACIATPHIAGYSAEGKMRATRMVLEAVKEFLGLPLDLTGLECIPLNSEKISGSLIERSYNPLTDSDNLKMDISRFESIRNNYKYRHEPMF